MLIKDDQNNQHAETTSVPLATATDASKLILNQFE